MKQKKSKWEYVKIVPDKVGRGYTTLIKNKKGKVLKKSRSIAL